MNLYLISRTGPVGYEEYDSAVVVATDEAQARLIHPANYIDQGKWFTPGSDCWCPGLSSWIKPEDVEVTFIGVADSRYKKPEVICASFNAG